MLFVVVNHSGGLSAGKLVQFVDITVVVDCHGKVRVSELKDFFLQRNFHGLVGVR